MSVQIHSEFQVADMTLIYQLDDITHMIGLVMYPTQLAGKLVVRRQFLSGGPEYPERGGTSEAWDVDPLVQVKWFGAEPVAGYGQGRTMRGSPATAAMKFDCQDVLKEGDVTTVITTLHAEQGYVCEHDLTWRKEDSWVTVVTTFRNESAQAVSLEMLSSFTLGGMTPFAPNDAPDRLLLHRFRSNWSAEGRLDTQSVEQLALERSWSGHAVRCERFGQVGSMPTNGFFPIVALEDRTAGALWGAQLAWAGSWQMEVFRRDDCLSISGGLADRELGHWVKTLAPGETFITPEATLTTTTGDVDALCHRLVSAQQRAVDNAPAVEADLPIIFNEWCTSWGKPTHDSMVKIADQLQGSPIRYLVIDAGWYAPLNGQWSSAQGDWIPNPIIYPQGLAATAQAIRQRGLIPGIWFEFEVAGLTAEAFKLTDHMLQRDGMTLTINGRRFWNMNDPWVVDYLSKRVIDLLRDCGIGYLKVDYNETIGVGVDGAESLGEGLRKHIEGIYKFFDLIRQELPHLVIENCSSGGHRLEPSIMGRCAMASFSDAHEAREIPIIAANLQRLILPRQSQIWAVMHNTDDRRLVYLLTSTFLGRMCLSGDITDLNDHQWGLINMAERLYQQVAPIIKHGQSHRLGPVVSSYRHPRGWQAVLRVHEADDGQQALVVAHSFGADVPPAVEIVLPDGQWQIVDSFHAGNNVPDITGTQLRLPFGGEYDSLVVYLTK
jgi:alpha-galactosidase